MDLFKRNLTEEQEQLWKLILATVEDLKKEHGGGRWGSNRGVALLTSDGNSVSTHLELGQADGSTTVFYINAWNRFGKSGIRVRRWFHNHEDLWEQRIRGLSANVAVIDGDFYTIGEEPPPRELREFPAGYGYSGARFTIRFNDGREVVTHNLWHGGTVPPVFRDRLPNNATFAGGAR